MTESEKQQIINEVLDSLKVNSLTIEQLVEVASFSSDDCVELTGGRRISLAMLKELFNKELTETVGKKLAISDLASGRGESTTTAMTQAAVTQELVAQEEKLTELSSNTDAKITELASGTNQFVFTYGTNTNKVIKHLYVDTTGYTGSYSLDGLKITNLNRNTTTNHLYGFRIKNGKDETIADFWSGYDSAPDYIEKTANGIYIYAEFYWSGMEDGTTLTEKDCYIRQISFDKIGDLKRIKDAEYKVFNEKIKNVETSVSELSSKIESESNRLDAKIETEVSAINSLFTSYTSINQFVGVGTANPEGLFSNRDESANAPKVQNIIDESSPFKDILGYCTKLSNTIQSNATSYVSTGIDYIKSRPNTIKFSFFTRKADWNEIDEGFMLGFGLYSYSPSILYTQILFDIKNVLAGTIINDSNDGTAFNCEYTISKGFDDGEYCQILLAMDVTGWKLSEDAGLRPLLQLSKQQTKWVNKSFLMINQQLVLDDEVPTSVFVCPDIDNVIDFYYPDSFDKRIEKLDKQIKDISDNIQSVQKANKFVYSAEQDGVSYIISPFNSTHNIRVEFVCKRSYSLNNNPCFNFKGVYLIDKNTKESKAVHINEDDIAPGSYNSMYIGANHGCSDLKKITCNSHGKTYRDIGSEWTNGNYKFYIIGIIDENTLWILGENYLEYPKWKFRTVNTGDTLSHVSGAVNKTDIQVANSASAQIRPALKVMSMTIYADGAQIKDSGEYQFDELNICEVYDVFNVASTLEKIKAKVGTFIDNPVYNDLGADKVVRHSINYKFTSADKCFVNTNFIAYQDINLSYFGFTQQSVLSGSDIKMYIPKTLPIIDGDESKDFRTIVSHNSVNGSVRITSEYWENPYFPPDRYIQSSENIVFNGGYMFDYGVGGNKRKDFINNAFYFYTTRKIYPYGIDSKISVSGGTSYSAVCFRIYTDKDKFNKNGIINQNCFEYEGYLYIYADFNASGFFELSVPDKYIGKVINVLEASENVKVLSETANSSVLVKVDSSEPMYGYAVIKVAP